MPRTIKLFLALSLLYVGWLVWWNIGFLVMPSPELLHTRASLPPDLRASAEQGDWIVAAIRIGLSLTFFLFFALTAVLARRNWARWGLALFLIAGEFSFFILVAYYAVLHPEISGVPDLTWAGAWHNWLQHWAYWQTDVRLALKLALILTIFGPGSSAWFRRPA